MEFPLRILSLVFVVWVVCLTFSSSSETPTANKYDAFLKKLLSGYAKNEPPSLLISKPTIVQLGIQINSFYSISEATMDYMLSFYLSQQWNDQRLIFNASDLNDRDHIKLGEVTRRAVWVPDTFFRNEKKANFHDVTVANRHLRLGNDGTMLYKLKISATFSCQMKLQKFPLDTQTCPITIESFGYTSNVMDYTWMESGGSSENAISLGNNKQLPQFTVENFTRHDCKQNYTAGQYPCLEVRFVLRRDIGFFLIQVYVPSILIVILSWVSFWINIESSPARVSIGLLTVLTTTTMSAGARASLPRVSYIKAIDVWMIICLIFVFASLIEYAVVNVMSRKKPKQKNKQKGSRRCLKCLEMGKKTKSYNCLECESSLNKPESDGKKKARHIDKLSRQCFPLAFVFFNIIYWTAYALPSSGQDDTI